jgi:carotenoid cleavage dioxygenase
MSSTLRPSASRYLAGNFAPVTEEVTADDLAVTGSLPEELNGRLLRIGPNPIAPQDPATYHWFLGDGMAHGLRLREGRAEWYRNRWIRSDGVAVALGEPPLAGPYHGMGDGNANTNIIGFAGRTWALVEAGAVPVELTDELGSVCRNDFSGTLDGSFTAHPKLDPATGELHAVTYYWEWDHVRHVVVGPDGRVSRSVRIPVADGPMVHDCALTETRVLVFDQPVTFDLERAMAGVRFPYRWNPDHGSRIGLLPRDGDADDVVWVESELCYVYHPMNAFDRPDGSVVVDVVRHPKTFADDPLGPNEGAPTLERWTLDPVAGRVRAQRLDDRAQEFPRIDERRTGRPHRYGYTAGFDLDATEGPIYRHDLEAGTTEAHDFGAGRKAMEPVFVPRAPDAAEDDGWVLTFVYDAVTDTSEVVVLSAQDLAGEPVATVHLPVRVPYGFHGNWVPDVG